jgi:hypothetical protein
MFSFFELEIFSFYIFSRKSYRNEDLGKSLQREISPRKEGKTIFYVLAIIIKYLLFKLNKFLRIINLISWLRSKTVML